MRIGIFSDCHCGYKFGEERGEDSFIALDEAMDKVSDCDIILIAGDIFDTRVPRPEVFSRAARILGKAQNYSSNAKLVEMIGKEKNEVSQSALRGTPIVTIHGTHERRSKYLVNPLESLEHAGILIHLSASTAVFDIEGKKVAIHGMSGVPDKFAGESFNEWNPKPVPEALNIMMLHNSISPYIYSPTEPPTMSIDDLPKGFDFYILGHMHWNEVRPLHEGRLLLCGSTIPTATRKSESEQLKCIFKYDGELRKIPLDFQRKIIWKEYDFDASTKDSIRNFIETISVDGPKPVINIKVKGVSKSLPSNFGDIEDKFAKKAIVNINKETENLKEQIEEIKAQRGEKLSPEEHGIRILQEKLNEAHCGIKIEEIFEYLVEGDTDLIFNILTGNQQTLKQGLEKWTA